MKISIEIKGHSRPDEVTQSLTSTIKKKFELSPLVTVLEPGTLEKEFKNQVKQQRFIDNRP